MDTSNFYLDLKAFKKLSNFVENKYFVSAPEDWLILITDVVGSTKAIESGRYKEVNALNAAVVSGILNIQKDLKKAIPFVFGGDGVTILIPKSLKDKAIGVLQRTRVIAKNYNLQNRSALVPVNEIYKLGQKIEVGKLFISDRYQQAIFRGSGLDTAESLIKKTSKYEVEMNDLVDPKALNAAGFTCRWQPIAAKQGAVLSLIVRSRKDEKVFLEVLKKIEEVFGPESLHHPLTAENLKLSLKIDDLSLEGMITSKTAFDGFIKTSIILIENILGILKISKSVTQNVAMKVQNNIMNSDFKKFDGSLKMVVAGSNDQIKVFENYLESIYKSGQIFYGIHKSDSSLITCLVFSDAEFEVHFVDGSDGGYAYAARGLKKQLKLNQQI
jgi:hypothetical protein